MTEVSFEDIERLAQELIIDWPARYGSNEMDWVAEINISAETLSRIIEIISSIMVEHLNEERDNMEEFAFEFVKNLAVSLTMAFVLGVQVQKQYGKPSTVVSRPPLRDAPRRPIQSTSQPRELEESDDDGKL